jgi:hypothetical protein
VWRVVLVTEEVMDRTEIALQGLYMMPFNRPINPGGAYLVHVGHTFDQWLLTGALGYARLDSSETIDGPFGGIEQDRWYSIVLAQVGVSYLIRTRSRFWRPYAGIFSGWGYARDVRRNDSFDEDKEVLEKQSIWMIGIRGGTLIAPFARVSVFLETRFSFSPLVFRRTSYESQDLLGGLMTDEETYRFAEASLGGGIKFYF